MPFEVWIRKQPPNWTIFLRTIWEQNKRDRLKNLSLLFYDGRFGFVGNFLRKTVPQNIPAGGSVKIKEPQTLATPNFSWS